MRTRALLLALTISGCGTPSRETAKPVSLAVSETHLRATVEKLVSFGTRHSCSTRGIGEAAAWLKAEFEKIPRLEVSYHEFTDPSPRLQRDGKPVLLKNVIARLRGTRRPDEVVVFGAHYDSLNRASSDPDVVAPGANDNATGTAGVLEAARILGQSEHDRTILFACFAAEEQGLFGAFHLAKSLKENGTKVVCMLNNDIIGGAKDDDGRPLNFDSLRCYSSPPQDSDSRRFARLAKLVVERSFPDFKVTIHETIDRPRRGGDHQSFNKHGFTAIRFIEAVETDKLHHTAGDVIERIHFPYHARVVRADVALLANLASAPPPPKGVDVKDAEESGTAEVTWDPVPGAASYIVSMRQEDQNRADLLEVKETRGTFRLQGAPQIRFCVAAVDARGNVSLFSPETPLN